jgi:hypothetical protein
MSRFTALRTLQIRVFRQSLLPLVYGEVRPSEAEYFDFLPALTGLRVLILGFDVLSTPLLGYLTCMTWLKLLHLEHLERTCTPQRNLRFLGGFSRLRWLGLHFGGLNAVMGEHFEFLPTLTRVKELNLSHNTFTLECLSHLVKMTWLESLNLAEARVTTHSGSGSSGSGPSKPMLDKGTLKVHHDKVEVQQLLQKIRDTWQLSGTV